MNTIKLDFTLLETIGNNVYNALPRLFLAIALIIAAWLILKAVMFVVKKSLKFTKIDVLSEKLNETPLFGSNFNIKLDKVILIFVKWFLILIFLIIGADFLGLSFISNEVSKLINFLPKIFTALAIFIFGIYGANYLKESIRSLLKAVDVGGSKAISQVVFILVALMVSILALNQAGLDTEIITKNIFLILGAILAAFTIAFGLGSRDIILRLLLGFYSKKNFKVGQRVSIDGEEGVIIAIESISMVIRFADKKVVYPIKYISNKKIEIID
ncbi:small-conductance mechanosensitive channel [Tamlana sedimentorum]|uniref:Small-conductance mechanosensitive channel n=1 Tax=Neotamlana sedimentorum TaxID=1435349 RepID=A0A0D7WB24_9FLAO|nr:mechanosensitive ion channel [Tamlana sedimentorum]KJD36264.1 small-conductance mechanosensitive channel [Tamlana sedimentorum]